MEKPLQTLLFTCLGSRAIHIDMIKSIQNDFYSYIHFIVSYGKVKIIRCDNSSNFAVAESDLGKCMAEQNHNKEIGKY